MFPFRYVWHLDGKRQKLLLWSWDFALDLSARMAVILCHLRFCSSQGHQIKQSPTQTSYQQRQILRQLNLCTSQPIPNQWVWCPYCICFQGIMSNLVCVYIGAHSIPPAESSPSEQLSSFLVSSMLSWKNRELLFRCDCQARKELNYQLTVCRAWSPLRWRVTEFKNACAIFGSNCSSISFCQNACKNTNTAVISVFNNQIAINTQHLHWECPWNMF